MIKRWLALTVLYLSVLAVPAANASDASVLWVTEAFPPFYISDGPQAGNGTADRLISLISKQLPEYNHTRQVFPIVRIIEELKAGSNVICITFLKDETIKGFAQYSRPVFVVPPQELVLRRESWEREFHSAASISMVDAMSRGRLVLGVSNGRHYGDVLNPLIGQYRSQSPNLVYSRTGDHFIGLSQMLRQGHIDMTIAYSGEKNFVSLDPAVANNVQLVSVPISENTEPLKVYAVLPRTAWGDRFLRAFDAALGKIHKDPEFRSAITKWFEPTPKFDAALTEITRDN